MTDDQGTTDLRRALAARIAELGLNQTEAADALGVSQSRVSRWLHGQPPGYERVPSIAKFLGVTEDETLRMIYGATQRPPNRRTAADRIDRVEEQLVELTTRLDAVLGALETQGLIAPSRADETATQPTPRRRRRRPA